MHELDWFGKGAVQQIGSETLALADMLNGLGGLIQNDQGDTGCFMNPDSASMLFFNLANQVSTINGLADIAVDANYRARLVRGEQP